jgi:hypothetical protein
MGFVYVVEAEARVKIGWTTDPHRRIPLLERQIGEEVYTWALLPGTRADERAAHHRWRRLALGGEWFRTTPALLKWADAQGAA